MWGKQAGLMPPAAPRVMKKMCFFSSLTAHTTVAIQKNKFPGTDVQKTAGDKEGHVEVSAFQKRLQCIDHFH